MTFGCILPTRGTLAAPENLRTLATQAEELGFDSVWVSDHIVVPKHVSSQYPYSVTPGNPLDPTQPYCEPLTVLGYLASATQRVRLGTHVLILPYRNPVLTGKVVATLDYLSHGRMILGVGVGWMEEEFQALGLTTFKERGAVSDEYIQILKALWTQQESSFQGRYHRFSQLGCFPKPVQKPHPPIWVGGHSAAALRRAARFGDGWLPIGLRPSIQLAPPELALKIAQLHDLASAAGRAPESVLVCFSANVEFTNGAGSGQGSRQLLTGSPEQIAGDIRAYQDIGVQYFNLGFGTEHLGIIQAGMERFTREVRPKVQE